MPYHETNLVSSNKRKKRTEQEHLSDLDRTAHLYLRGYSIHQIAKIISEESHYSISHVQILRDIKKIRQIWINNASSAYEEAIGRELAKIDELEKAYWDGYEKANGDKTILLKEIVKSDDDNKNRELKKVTQQGGLGSEFLKGIQWCINKRLELLGVQSASKSMTISWEDQAKKDGVGNPEELFETVVKALMNKMQDNKDVSYDDAKGEILDGILLPEKTELD